MTSANNAEGFNNRTTTTLRETRGSPRIASSCATPNLYVAPAEYSHLLVPSRRSIDPRGRKKSISRRKKLGSPAYTEEITRAAMTSEGYERHGVGDPGDVPRERTKKSEGGIRKKRKEEKKEKERERKKRRGKEFRARQVKRFERV